MNVFVTGANRGLGLEFVKQYAEEGATVYACCRDPGASKALRRVSDEAGGKVSLHCLDVTNDKAVAIFSESFGDEPIDVLINNAGIYGPENQSADNMDFDVWAKTFAVNAMAPLRVAQTFRRNLKKGKAKKLVTITSAMGCTAQHGGDFFRLSLVEGRGEQCHARARACVEERRHHRLTHSSGLGKDGYGRQECGARTA